MNFVSDTFQLMTENENQKHGSSNQGFKDLGKKIHLIGVKKEFACLTIAEKSGTEYGGTEPDGDIFCSISFGLPKADYKNDKACTQQY